MGVLRPHLPTTRRQRVISGFLLGVLLLILYVSLVGVEDIRRMLWAVPPRQVVLVVGISLVPLFFWGLGLRLIFGRLGYSVRISSSVLLFSISDFFNTITPFGQVGGDPLTAVVYQRILGADFETSLAGIGSLNALNQLAAVMLGVLGVGVLSAQVAAGGSLRDFALLVSWLSITVAFGLFVGWQYRYRIITGLAVATTPVVRGIVRMLPGVAPPDRTAIERRGYRFVGALERLASDPVRLILVFGLSIAGQVSVAAALWIALAILGFHASLPIVLLIIPIAKLSGISPTPGGLGSAELLLGMLLVATTEVSPPVAAGAVLLYRLAAFWFPSLIGALAIGWLIAAEEARDS